jgi:hypothetical protein
MEEVASALKVDAGSVREYFTDGRRVAFLIERRIAKEEGFSLATSEGASFDLVDKSGGKWEVRNITLVEFISAQVTWSDPAEHSICQDSLENWPGSTVIL